MHSEVLRGGVLWKATGLAICLIAVGLAGLLWQLRDGATVTVANRSGAAIREVVLTYRGGTTQIGNFKDGQSGRVTVHPKGDSGLEIMFLDVTGKQRLKEIDTYIAPNIKSAVDIVIGPEDISAQE